MDISKMRIRTLCLLLCAVVGNSAEKVKLINNGYEGILLAISDCIEESKYPNITEDLQVRLSCLSTTLEQVNG